MLVDVVRLVQKTEHFEGSEKEELSPPSASDVTFVMAYSLSFLLLVCTYACEIVSFASPVEQSESYQEALEKYQSKDYPAALAAARRAVDEDGNNASYCHIYGLALAAVQQFREAEENLQKAITLKPSEANFHYDYGYVLFQQRK